MPVLHLTDSAVEALEPAPTGKQVLYYDDEQRGLAVRVTAGSKVYVLELWQNGRTHRQKIADCGAIGVGAAKKAARVLLGEAAAGVDLRAKRIEQRRVSTTFAEAAREFMKVRKIAPRTRADYQDIIVNVLADLADVPLVRIDKGRVLSLHQKLTEQRGPTRANYAMRVLRAVWRSHEDELELPRNPVTALGKAKAWNPERARDNFVRAGELPVFWSTTEGLRFAKDQLRFMILTGLRRGEAIALTWGEIDFRDRSLTLRETKNRRPHRLPLSDFLLEMLQARKPAKGKPTDRVFPRGGDPRKALEAIGEAIGRPVTMHDLRRSFATYCEQLNLSTFVTKRLLNHVSGGDVTAKHYVQIEFEQLREPMHRITAFVLTKAAETSSAEVLPIKKAIRRNRVAKV